VPALVVGQVIIVGPGQPVRLARGARRRKGSATWSAAMTDSEEELAFEKIVILPVDVKHFIHDFCILYYIVTNSRNEK
jgi:hypothetical protein